MLNAFWTLRFGAGLEVLLAKMLWIRELELSHVSFEYGKVLKQGLKKYLQIFGSYSQPGSRGISALFHWVKGLYLKRWRTLCASLWPLIHQYNCQLLLQLLFLIHIVTGEAKDSGMWMLKHGLNYLSFERQKFAFQHSP